MKVKEILDDWRILPNSEGKYFMVKVAKLIDSISEDVGHFEFLKQDQITEGWRVIDFKVLNDSLFKKESP